MTINNIAFISQGFTTERSLWRSLLIYTQIPGIDIQKIVSTKLTIKLNINGVLSGAHVSSVGALLAEKICFDRKGAITLI